MPKRDGTGPFGTGAMTGRGLGLGSGFGCRRSSFFNSALLEPDEKDMLSAEKDMLEIRLKAINKHLDRMKKKR